MNIRPPPYTPIPCARYSELELAIMHRRTLRLALRGGRHPGRISTLRPLDLRTRRHAEYLIGRTPAGTLRVLRLDRILRMQDGNPG